MVRVLEEGFFWIGSMKVDSFSRHLFFFFGKENNGMKNPSKVYKPWIESKKTLKKSMSYQEWLAN